MLTDYSDPDVVHEYADDGQQQNLLATNPVRNCTVRNGQHDS